jgi:hypothetical protein
MVQTFVLKKLQILDVVPFASTWESWLVSKTFVVFRILTHAHAYVIVTIISPQFSQNNLPVGIKIFCLLYLRL